nr:uncharacterized protein LOC112805458 [Arachis hypogaea]
MEEQATDLEKFPTMEEIKKIVWSCGSTKVPRPDGFNMVFIKRTWDIIGGEFSETMMQFYRIGYLPKSLNMTRVMLASKVDVPTEIKDFNPISMIESIYKVISKVMVDRIKKVMKNLVVEVQTAFIQDRQILYGALIACEMVAWLKKKKKQGIILKPDFQKAYYVVRWSFVDHVLSRMGFGFKWRGWIQGLLQTSMMSILINDSPSEPF